MRVESSGVRLMQILAMAAAWAALVASTQPVLAERRMALVFGTDAYREVRPLANAVNDAVAVQRLLETLGFEVFLETNRDLRRMRRAVEDFAEDAAGADLAVFFFAGHGVEIGGRNLLLPVDAVGSTAEALTASALPLEEVVATLRAVAPAAMVILDACREDPFAGSDSHPDGRGATALPRARTTAAVRPGLGRMGRADGLLFAFAAAPGTTAADGHGDNSPFTEALLRHLPTAGVEVGSALTLVRQAVYDRTRGAQLPYVEAAIPRAVFLSGPAGTLPERERLLLAMADLSPDLRGEVEAVAARYDMPLAPLFGALLSADLGQASRAERAERLDEAARAFREMQESLRRFASDDPRVQALRGAAQAELELGAFETARARLSEAVRIDAEAGEALAETLLARRLSEAESHILNGTAARADLRYDLALADLALAEARLSQVAALDPDAAEVQARRAAVAATRADLARLTGDLSAALEEARRWRDLATMGPDAAAAQEMLGDIHLQRGEIAPAEAALRAALDLRRAVRDRTPGEPDAEYAHAAAHLLLGDALMQQGSRSEAMRLYFEADLIADALFFDAVFSGLSAIGIVQTGRPSAMQADAAIRERRLRELRVRANLRLSGFWLHEPDMGWSYLDTAREALDTMEDADPGDWAVREYRATADTQAAFLSLAAGEPKTAQATMRAAEARWRRLVAEDPQNLPLRARLVGALVDLATIELDAGAREAASGALLSASVEAALLIKRDPANEEWRDLGARIALREAEMTDGAAALAAYRTAAALADGLSAQSTRHADLLRAVSTALRDRGDALPAPEAAAFWAESLAVGDRLAARRPEDASARLGTAMDRIGLAHRMADKTRLLSEAAAILDTLAEGPGADDLGWRIGAVRGVLADVAERYGVSLP